MKLSSITHQRGFHNYRWDGLTAGALLAIYHALKGYQQQSTLARELVVWLESNNFDGGLTFEE